MIKMTLERKIILNSLVPDICSALVIFCYTIVSTQLPFGYIFPALRFLLIMIVIAQFVIAPFFDHLAYSKISARVETFLQTGLDKNERTKLLEDLSHVPFTCAVMTIIYFVIGSIMLSCMYSFTLHLSRPVNMLSLSECLYGSFISGLFAYNYCRRICSKYAYKIVAKGIDKSYIMKRGFLSTGIGMQIFLFVGIPIICTGVLNAYILVIGYLPLDNPSLWPSENLQVRRAVLTTFVNVFLQTSLALLFFLRLDASNKKMESALEAMTQSDLTKAKLLDTDIRDEVSYNHFLANEMLLLFRSILNRSIQIAQQVDDSASHLKNFSAKTETTANEQSTSADEIVATMHSAKELSHKISTEITDVTEIAHQTAENVSEGLELLKQNLDKISAISNSNLITISGIQETNEKINTIWNIVSIINSIADQTKIIAFNAELEASNVRDGEMNFKNVANEIRRLANRTMDSTKEIKERISDIQAASDSLLQSSQRGTEQISHGMEMAHSLAERFANIKESSESNAQASEQIKTLINQETEAFEQIFTTLNQISISVESFKSSIHTITSTAAQLKDSALTLSTINTDDSTQNIM